MGALCTEASTGCPVTAFSVSIQLADDQGLVLMTTVAMPVFSKQNETVSMAMCPLPGAGGVGEEGCFSNSFASEL